MPMSAYASSCGAPTLQDEKRNGFKELLDDGWRVVQRAVNAESL